MRGAWRLAWVAGLLVVAGCGTGARSMAALNRPDHVSPPCRFEVTPGSGPPEAPLGWTVPGRARDLRALDAWCRATGPAVVGPRPATSPAPAREFALVSWNLHAGAADLDTFVSRLRAGSYTEGRPVGRFVLLLQEAHRGGPDVPQPGAGAAPRGQVGRHRPSADVAALARQLGLAMIYVPSMRNGPARLVYEDRGNAILSTEPLTDLEAIELPFERQRRVAVAATIQVPGPGGRPQPIRVVSVHLDVAASYRKLWVFGARTQQVRSLLSVLPPRGPMVIGGDFNTWFGYSDRAYRTLAASLPDISRSDRRPTMGPLRLDHVFSRVPDGWLTRARRLDDRLGSDHYPILVRLSGPDVTPAVVPE